MLARTSLRRGIGSLLSWVERLSEWMAYFGAASIMIMMFAVSADLFSRKLANSPIAGILEFTVLLLVIIGFLGLATTAVHGRHVRIDILLSLVGPRTRAIMEIFSLIITLSVGVLLAVYTGERAIISVQTGEFDMGLLRFPVWPSRLAVFGGIALFDIYMFLHLVARLLAPFRFEAEESAAHPDD